ncbi:tetratricopeptide repeat protein [Steroidobacter flavus]|uniref:Tetratricopeptide repeat protein n=1 Tax=Steroidobacter flavus TaxID=1842136 RepID=A0ABV8SQL0_9GAMM
MTVHPRSIAAIVDEAQQLPEEDRLQFLRQACASDSQLYESAVAELHSRPHSRQNWFDSAGSEAEPDAMFEQRRTLTGERIGAYRLVRSLGEGGMGEVFLAERADAQFKQQVAIKLVRRGLLSGQSQQRLRMERQILATLDHPNIARLFDGGTTSDGTPYIVMEYIDGEPIDTYCDRRNLNIEARLKLFQAVCSAVHRAHQNLIVHRDLKPSNILVTADGTPKLLDFGIAKWLDDNGHMMHTMAVTQADIRVMTPGHASPEQVRGDLITTASDIYVLGVLLHELLCGFKPFVVRGIRMAELERTICEDDPPSPSEAIGIARESSHSSIDQVAAQRGTTPAKLQRQLRGDLDNIVAMAMRKEPERRYPSVEQLNADIDRLQRGLPVMARPDSWSYRSSKFIKRHGAALGLGAAFLALLIGFSITTLIQSKRVERERDVATKERTIAEAERERAEAVSEFLVESFTNADPARARGDSITAREILDVGAQRIANKLRGQPELQATLMDTIGTVYLGLGQLDRAQPLIEQALSIRRARFGEDNIDVGRSLFNLNRIYGERGDLVKAEQLARSSLALAEKHTGADSLQTALNLCQLGVILHRQDKWAAAEQSLQRCLDIRIARLGKTHELVADPLDNLALIAIDRMDFDTAERLAREAVAIDKQARQADHPLYARHLQNLASALQGKGDLKAAGPLYRQAIDLFDRVLGPKHFETIDAMSNYGRCLMKEGRLDEAQQIFATMLARDREIRPDHAYVGHDLESLGRVALRKHDYVTAERHLREALGIYRKTLPPEHGYITTTLTRLGRTLLELKRFKEAEATLGQAVDAWATSYGKDSSGYAAASALRGRVWARLGNTGEAERVFAASYPILVRSEVSPDVISAQELHTWIEELKQK